MSYTRYQMFMTHSVPCTRHHSRENVEEGIWRACMPSRAVETRRWRFVVLPLFWTIAASMYEDLFYLYQVPAFIAVPPCLRTLQVGYHGVASSIIVF